MDNAQKAIMIGVGLFITIIIISAVLLVSNIGTNLISGAQAKLSGISRALQNQITQVYDGKTMTGADVIAAVQQYENSDMSIIVYLGKYVNQPNYDMYASTGKYYLAYENIFTSKDGTEKPARTTSYPGGVYYKGEYRDFPAEEAKVTLTALQSSTGYGVNATKTYYSSIIKDASTDTVVGILFVQK